MQVQKINLYFIKIMGIKMEFKEVLIIFSQRGSYIVHNVKNNSIEHTYNLTNFYLSVNTPITKEIFNKIIEWIKKNNYSILAEEYSQDEKGHMLITYSFLKK